MIPALHGDIDTAWAEAKGSRAISKATLNPAKRGDLKSARRADVPEVTGLVPANLKHLAAR